MTQPSASKKPKPYGRGGKAAPLVVSVHLAGDIAAIVLQLAAEHNLSNSGAVHHLARLGAGLPSLLP